MIPEKDLLPHPAIIEHKSFENIGAGEQSIENKVNVTILFPDANDFEPTNGPFKTQEEFRKFMLETNGARVQTTFYTRPSRKRANDYFHDEFIKAFPGHFPYGIGGFSQESSLQLFFKKRLHKKQSFENRIRHLLQCNIRVIHDSIFNLVANGVLMRNEVFSQVRLRCNLRHKERYSMGELFGQMSHQDLNRSIQKARLNTYISSISATDQFLNSISAVSQCLPHSNEAATTAQKNYFSFLVRFGLPALFITISPDDKRCIFIQIALNKNVSKFDPHVINYDHCIFDEMLKSYKERLHDRMNYPGLCAEEYEAICDAFIKEILRWDKKHNLTPGLDYLEKLRHLQEEPKSKLEKLYISIF